MTDIRGIIFHTFGETEEPLYNWLQKTNQIEWERGFPEAYKPGPKVNRPTNTGCTGKDLEKEMENRLKLYKLRFTGFKVVLIEDDLDYMPWNNCAAQETIENRAIHAKAWLDSKYRELVPKVQNAYSNDIDLVILYASPEVETWFLADWQNGMGKICEDDMFCAALNRSLKEKLAEYYDEHIELWHYYPSSRAKLSDIIIKMIFDLQMTMEDADGNIPLEGLFSMDERKRIDGSKFEYKKTNHGKHMLEDIDQEKVYEKCQYFYRHAIDKIREIQKRNL